MPTNDRQARDGGNVASPTGNRNPAITRISSALLALPPLVRVAVHHSGGRTNGPRSFGDGSPGASGRRRSGVSRVPQFVRSAISRCVAAGTKSLTLADLPAAAQRAVGRDQAESDVPGRDREIVLRLVQVLLGGQHGREVGGALPVLVHRDLQRAVRGL